MAQTLLIFPRSYKTTRRVGILRSDTTTQLCFALLYTRTDPRWLIPPVRALHSMAAIHLGSSPLPVWLRYGMISPVPGRGKHPVPVCCRLLLQVPSSSLGLWMLRLLSALQGVCWGSAPGKAGPALSSRFSYSFASDEPFLSTLTIFLLFHFSKTVIQAKRLQLVIQIKLSRTKTLYIHS